MAVRLEEWTQSHWVTPGVNLYANYGDYLELSNLLPSRDGKQLVRLPAWSSQVRTDTNGLTDVRGAFYDADNDRIVLVGSDGSDDLSSSYLDASWSLSGLSTLDSSVVNLGGFNQRNIAWYGGVFYLVNSDGEVLSDTDYSSSMGVFDADTDHRILQPIDERLYMVTTDCKVFQTSDDNSVFDLYVEPKNNMGMPQGLVPYRGYALLIVRSDEGRLLFLRVPLDTTTRSFQEISSLREPGHLPANGSLYVLHRDEVYFSPGYYNRPGSEIGLNIYSFNGSRIQHVAEIRHAPNTGGGGFPAGAGLLSWRGELLYWAMEGTSQIFKVLKGGRFAEFPSLAATATTNPFAAVVGGHLIATADDTNEGIHYLQDTVLDDGYVVSSKLDMGRPGKQKRLEQIAVLLDDRASDFKPTIKYRVDDATSWTTAVVGNNSRRVSVGGLGVDFYTLQLQVLLDDDTAGNKDIRIEAVSVIYSVGDV